MRIGLWGAALSLCLVGLCSAQNSSASIRKDLNVPAEDLSPALQTVATTYELQVLYATHVAKDLKTHGAVGAFTFDEALTKVLSGTGLSYKYLDATTVTIVTFAGTNAAATANQDRTQNAQDTAKEGKTASSGQFLLARAPGGQDQGTTSLDEPEGPDSKKKPLALEEVVVVGSRFPSASGQQAVPVRTYTQSDIDNSNQTTVAGFLNNLPDVSTAVSENGFQTGGFPGKTTVQLHGLPVGTTLVLLNGRRLESSSLGFFDLNSLPLAAVERIEILPVGASAVYGADALGGAVNIVTRKDLNGFEARGEYGHASGTDDINGDIAWGKKWNRGSISLLASYQNTSELLGSQREVTSRTNVPADSFSAFLVQDSCAPGNVYSLNGQNLPGLSSSQAAIPTGLSGRPTISQFGATAGKVDQCGFWAVNALVPLTQRTGALASAHYQIADSADLFFETLASHEHLSGATGLMVSTSHATLSGSNPYNPFGEDVAVSFADPNIRQSWDEMGNLLRPLIGVRGSILTDWHYEAIAYFSHDRFEADVLVPNFQAVQTALSSSNPSTALNPFALNSPLMLPILQSLAAPAADLSSQYVNNIDDAQVIAHGPLVRLPAGQLDLVLGGEYSRETQQTTSGLSVFDLSRRSSAAFAEARVPLLAPRVNSGGGGELTLTAASRYDHTSDFGSKLTWQAGLLWRPWESFSVTGSYGTSYKAPQFSEINGLQSTSVAGNNPGIVDPFRGGQDIPATAILLFGSNPNLKAETGSSRALSVQYGDAAVRGLLASITYFEIDLENYISQHSNQELVDNPDLFPGAVTRAPPSAQDQLLGFLGPITQINNIFYNFGALRVAGVDADLSYTFDGPLGQFRPSISASNIFRWQSALTPNSPLASYVSQAGENPGWAPRYKGNAALAWSRGPIVANLVGRYVSRYTDYQYVPNTNELGNTWIFDFSLDYAIGKSLWSGGGALAAGTHVSLGVVNLFDKAPPFSYGIWPYDYTQYDIRGRIISGKIGVKW